MNFYMSHDKRDVIEQQFNDQGDPIFKLLRDLGYNINMLIAVKYDNDLSKNHKKIKIVLLIIILLKVGKSYYFHFRLIIFF